MTRAVTDYLRPDWPAPKNVCAVATTRSGGFSKGAYAGMNLAMHVGDDPQDVQRNRQQLVRLLGLPREPVWLEQVHGTAVCRLYGDSAPGAVPPQADAAWTSEVGIVCCVMTADCLPILLCDPAGTRVGVVHAGWRGLAGGVIEAALAALGSGKLIAWLGPAISQAAYEVGPEVRAACVARYPEAHAAFAMNASGRWQADLYTIARGALAQSGIDRVFGGDFCTRRDARRFFSHRRESPCGRMASLIWLKSG
jgi:YfiH family protein